MLEDHTEKASADQRPKDSRERIPRRTIWLRNSKSSDVRTGPHTVRPQQGDVKKRRGQEGARATCMVSQSPAPELCTDWKLRSTMPALASLYSCSVSKGQLLRKSVKVGQ